MHDAHARLVSEYPGIFILCTVLITNISAQFLKVILFRLVEHQWQWGALITTGGMPSSHAATVVSATTSVGIISGINSVEFAIIAVFTGVVLYDALGIRRQAGKQAQVLNQMAADLQAFGKKLFRDLPYDVKLKELIGHEPIEVLAGILYGLLMTFLSFFFFYYMLS